MIVPNYEFCDELETPEILVVLKQDWWMQNYKEIDSWLPQAGAIGYGNTMYWIPNPVDRTYFMLRWPQWS
jgi:hypothetical protein